MKQCSAYPTLTCFWAFSSSVSKKTLNGVCVCVSQFFVLQLGSCRAGPALPSVTENALDSDVVERLKKDL